MKKNIVKFISLLFVATIITSLFVPAVSAQAKAKPKSGVYHVETESGMQQIPRPAASGGFKYYIALDADPETDQYDYYQWSDRYPGYFNLNMPLPYQMFNIDYKISYSNKKICNVKVVNDIKSYAWDALIKPKKAGKTTVTITFTSKLDNVEPAVYKFDVEVLKKGYSIAKIVNKSGKIIITKVKDGSVEGYTFKRGAETTGTAMVKKSIYISKDAYCMHSTFVDGTPKKYKYDFTEYYGANRPRLIQNEKGKVVENKEYKDMMEWFGGYTLLEGITDTRIAIKMLRENNATVKEASYNNGSRDKRTAHSLYEYIATANGACTEFAQFMHFMCDIMGVPSIILGNTAENHDEIFFYVDGDLVLRPQSWYE